MKTFQYVHITFIDNQFSSAYLFIDVEHNGTKLCNQYVEIKNYHEAIKAMRKIEQVAHETAKINDFDMWLNHHKYHFTEKLISFLQCTE